MYRGRQHVYKPEYFASKVFANCQPCHAWTPAAIAAELFDMNANFGVTSAIPQNGKIYFTLIQSSSSPSGLGYFFCDREASQANLALIELLMNVS
jgi:hypothetical protein